MPQPQTEHAGPTSFPIAWNRGKAFQWVSAAAVVGVFTALLIQINLRISHGHSGDFRHFYFASRAMLMHQDPYAPGTGGLDAGTVSPTGDFRAGTGGYLYPPLIAFLYTPVARLDYRVAQRVVLVVNMVCIAAGLFLISRVYLDRLGSRAVPAEAGTPVGMFGLLAPVVALGLLMDVDKVRLELQMFQTNALMFLMFALSLKWVDRRPVLAGVPLGVILNIKYLSLAMLPWLLIRRRWWTAIAMVVSTVCFALLPAVVSGWKANLHDLSVASGGLATMVGAGSGTAGPQEQANVEDIRAWFSISITSAMARMADLFGSTLKVGLAFAAGVALACLGVAVWLYLRNGVPLVRWPTAAGQQFAPYKTAIGLEFTALIAATLCFSPQTNTRHLLLALFVTVPAAVLMLTARPPRARLVVGIAIAFMFFCFVFPPGNRFTLAHHLSELWFGVGALSWGLLVALFTVISVGLSQSRSDSQPMPS
jgi:hypothetical protein